jgi:rod shape-determining protein MreC
VSIEFAPKMKEGRLIYVLIPLLLLHLALISLQIEDPAGTILFKKAVFLASAPFFNLSAGISRGANYVWQNYVWLRGARQENLQLKDAVRQLSLREKALAQAQDENARLRRLLDLRSTLPFEGIAAHVVGRAPSYLSNVLYVDRGSASGIRVDSPALSGDGVIGRVILTSPHNSQVQLITNADASIGVMVERTRSPGVLKGSGNDLLSLNYISNTEQIEVGDMVVSSGLDGIYPKGLPVGRIVESYKGKSVFRVIQVAPQADLMRIEEVLILPGPSKRE